MWLECSLFCLFCFPLCWLHSQAALSTRWYGELLVYRFSVQHQRKSRRILNFDCLSVFQMPNGPVLAVTHTHAPHTHTHTLTLPSPWVPGELREILMKLNKMQWGLDILIFTVVLVLRAYSSGMLNWQNAKECLCWVMARGRRAFTIWIWKMTPRSKS